MRIALATCADLPDWEVDDDALKAALKDRNVSFDCPRWDDPHYAWGSVDACLIRTTWDYMLRRQEYVTWADHVQTQTRLFNSASVIRWNTHKHYLKELEDRGVSIVPTVWLSAGTIPDVETIVRERGWDRAFIKPAIGATARETLRFNADREGLRIAKQHVARLIDQEDLLIQPYLASVEQQGELSVIFIEGEITHAVRKIPLPGDYRVQDDFGASDEPVELNAEEMNTARQAVRAVNDELLYARVDFLRDDQGALCLNELELVEPLLFFRHGPQAANRLAEALIARL